MTATIEEGLVAFLNANEAVDALCAGRIYPDGGAPDDAARPYITYRKISGTRELTHDGDARLEHPRIQLSSWSEDYLQAKQLAKAVKQCLSGYRGLMADVPVAACTIDGDMDLFVPEERFHQVAVDLTLISSET